VALPFRARAAALGKLIELLVFPSFCVLCRSPLDEPGERVVCGECLAGLRPRKGASCLCCGRFFDGVAEPHLCAACLEHPPDFSVHRSCGAYGGVLKDLILLYKYRHLSVLGGVLSRYVVASLAADGILWQDVDYLVPVPLDRKRKRERGFNQSQVLARGLGKLRGLEVLDRCLIKTKAVPPQTTLEAAARETNVRGAYSVKRSGRLEGRVVLLVDDVFTTGSTLRECARVLKHSGARDVKALTLAQA